MDCVRVFVSLSAELCPSIKTLVFSSGATFFDWTKDGVDEDQDIPVQLQTDSDTFAAEMEAKGVGTDRPVVVRPSQHGNCNY